MQFNFTEVSGNIKTGPMSVSRASSDTCPSSCGLFYECYGKCGHVRIHWDKLDRGEGNALSFSEYLSVLKRKADGIFRHGEAGDLPGKRNKIDREKMKAMVKALHKAKPFAYTHKPMFAGLYRVKGPRGQVNKGRISEALAENNRQAVKETNESGFVVNLSADNLEQADKLAGLGIAPVVTVLPADAAEGVRYSTPEGQKVVVCPAAVLANKDKGITCKNCRLCAVPNRKSIIGFPAHGTAKNRLNKRLKGE